MQISFIKVGFKDKGTSVSAELCYYDEKDCEEKGEIDVFISALEKAIKMLSLCCVVNYAFLHKT